MFKADVSGKSLEIKRYLAIQFAESLGYAVQRGCSELARQVQRR